MKKISAYLLAKTQTKFAHGLYMVFVGSLVTGLTTCLGTTPPHVPTKADLLAILVGGIVTAGLYICKNVQAGTGTPQSPIQNPTPDVNPN